MGLFKLLTLALATGATASTYYGNLPEPSSGPGNVVVATTVVTVTSIVSYIMGVKCLIELRASKPIYIAFSILLKTISLTSCSGQWPAR